MSARWSALLVTALVVTALLGASLVTATPAAAGADGVEFGNAPYQAHQGDLVRIPISVPPGANATLWLQRTTNAVTTRVTVGDGGDGSIVIVLNTHDGSWSVEASSDRVHAQDTNPERPVRPDTYALAVETDSGSARTTVTVQDSGLQRLTTWRLPNRSSPADADSLRAAIEQGSVHRAEHLSANDTLVIQLDATGLSGAIASMSGQDVTDRFLELFSTHGAIHIVQAYPPPSLQPAHFDLANSTGVAVVPDTANDTYYLTIDVSEARLLRGDYHEEDFRWKDAAFDVSVELDAKTTVSETGTRLAAFVGERDVRLPTEPDGRIHLYPAKGQEITGQTNVGTGWNVTVVVRVPDDPSTDENESFNKRQRARVTQAPDEHGDNQFSATLNLSNAPSGTDASVDVLFDGESLLDAPINARIEGTTATMQISDVERVTRTTVEVSTALVGGGFVVLHANSADGPVIGTSRYLAPGDHDVTVYVGEPTDATQIVAVAHTDANNNEWFDGPSVDTPYRNDATASVERPPPTTDMSSSTTPATSSDSSNAQSNETSTPAGSPASERTSGPVPGLSVLAGLIAVVSGVLLAARFRRN